MAELPHLGKHCAHASCRRLDYLSIGCSGCGEAFCKEHFAFDNHDCSKQHLNHAGKKQYVGVKGYSCAYDKCSARELTEVICEFCGGNFCLQHRHQVDHSCPAYEKPADRMTATREHVQNIVDKQAAGSKPVKGKGHKSKATAAKVALMKIKMKAVGDKGIPDSERIYVNVNLPQGCKSSPKAVYFSAQWTFGRVIDDIASRAKLENKNNVATAKKLKLFDPDTGVAFPFESRVQDAVESAVFFSGSTLALHYVDPQTEVLLDISSNKI